MSLAGPIQATKDVVQRADRYHVASVNDVLMSWGKDDTKGLFRLDHKWYGSHGTSLIHHDASADESRVKGPMRLTGYNSLSRRFELKWVAGQRGKPGINADINSVTESVREIADPDFELLGLNAVSTTSAYYAESGIVLTTTAGATDAVILLPHLDTSQTPWANITWGTDQETEWECLIGTDATITNEVLYAGLKLTNTDVTATDADQVFFRFTDGTAGGSWQANSSIANVDTETDSGVDVAASTNYHLKITIDSSRIARMYIDGVLVSTTAALTTAVDLIPYIGILNESAAAHAIRVYGQSISRKIGA